jgi:endonuclease V-like protein UPF0215 family
MKKEARIIGIDDAPFQKESKEPVLVVGTIFRGGEFMDGLISCYIEKDGEDATLKIIEMINQCKFRTQLQAIMLDGIAVGGFNVINANALNRHTRLPVIIVMREYPEYDKMFSALRKIKMEKKIELIKQLPKPIKHNDIYYQNIGIEKEKAEELLLLSSTHSFLPEPIRVAHLITSGITDGESRGRA